MKIIIAGDLKFNRKTQDIHILLKDIYFNSKLVAVEDKQNANN